MTKRTQQELVRFEKLEELRSRGFNYPNDTKITGSSKDVLKAELVEDASQAPRFTVAGRLMLIRVMGKAAFCHILDGEGKLQLYVKKDEIGPEAYEHFKELDLGDLVEARGYAFVTKTGEKSLHVESIRIIAKSLIPLPEKWHGLTDVETRYRHRYVDLIANPEVRELFKKRAKIINGIRYFLDSRGFVEVETPVLQSIAGGTTARPFKTHHNSLGIDMYLRIALELPLKKLIVGGIEKVYELGRNFRNEGISKKHNPEFTMLEFYEAYATFEEHMVLLEELLREICASIHGAPHFTFSGHSIDLSQPWRRISMVDSIYEIGELSRSYDLQNDEDVRRALKDNRIDCKDSNDWGRGIEALWENLVEHKLIQPTFITHHPFSISPLARKNSDNHRITDRYELFIGGMEVANGYSELNDPVDQRERFTAQSLRKAQGDEEAMEIDEDFLKALEYGMAPTAGDGIGIDRLVMLLTDSPTIRDVVLFPQLKPLEEEQEG